MGKTRLKRALHEVLEAKLRVEQQQSLIARLHRDGLEATDAEKVLASLQADYHSRTFALSRIGYELLTPRPATPAELARLFGDSAGQTTDRVEGGKNPKSVKRGKAGSRAAKLAPERRRKKQAASRRLKSKP